MTIALHPATFADATPRILGAGPGSPNTRDDAPAFELCEERYRWMADMPASSRDYWLRTFLCEHDHMNRKLPVPGIAHAPWQLRWEREATFHMPRAWAAWERALRKWGR